MDLCDPNYSVSISEKVLKTKKKYQMKLYFHNRFLLFWGGSFWPNFQLWPNIFGLEIAKVAPPAPSLRYAAGARIKDSNEHLTRISVYPYDKYFDDGHASATVDFGVRKGIRKIYALAPSALAFTMLKFTREYRLSRAIIIGRTSTTVGLFLGYWSEKHIIFSLKFKISIEYRASVILDDGCTSAINSCV